MISSEGPGQVLRQHQAMARRLKKELADIEFRIAQGLDRCDQFFGDSDDMHDQLLYCRHSRSNKRLLSMDFYSEAPRALDFLFRALKGNNDAIHIEFYCDSDESDQQYAGFAEVICNLPSVTDSTRCAALHLQLR
jgi:hypothetical protein